MVDVVAGSFRLKIQSARFSDSGNYSCVPTIGESSNVMVHIINGKFYSNVLKISIMMSGKEDSPLIFIMVEVINKL